MSNDKPKILLLISGSIAAYKALDLLSQLTKWGADTRVVLSAGAERFITAASVEGLTGRVPHGQLFASGDAMAHIRLAEWADLALVYPASASTINRLAAGLADDLIGTLSLARVPTTPFWLAPAMNPKMWAHPAVQAAASRLQDWSYRVIDPDSGSMACGDSGPGRLVEPEAMLLEIQRWHQKRQRGEPGLRWLITAGGTREAFDAVRFVGNTSTGETAAQLAEALLDLGDEVTLLAAAHARSVQPHQRLRVEHFTSFADLARLLEAELGRHPYDAVAHAAAVSDFLVANAMPESKLDSTSESLSLELTRSPKLLDRIRGWSCSERLYLAGFKLLTNAAPEQVADAVARQQTAARTDVTVFNDSTDISAGRRRGQLWKDGQVLDRYQDPRELAERLRADALKSLDKQGLDTSPP